jgi:dihydrofolate synthase/folylpolyglutamate synthase
LPETLADWLAYVERVHSRPIDLGLERVRRVQSALGQWQSFPVIVVGGTNGKGSTCAMLESVLRCAGYRVGLYTSPHLLRYNERVRVDGQAVSDAELIRAFAEVEQAREGTALTYFEFGTLAAWQVFARQGLDAAILEVGLGGRLDAVNVFDAECAVITSVDLDHMEYLGPTREDIGFEKAGIFRAGRPAVVGDPAPPGRLLGHARGIGADLRLLGTDFGFTAEKGQWQYWSRSAGAVQRRSGLAWPALRGANQLLNAATAIAALEAVAGVLPVAMQDLRRGLMEVELPGRFQVLPGRPAVVLDVAHNPQAARVLASNLGDMAFFPCTWAVFGMLRDKDIAAVARAMRGHVDRWLACTLDGPRGADAGALTFALREAGVPDAAMERFDSPAEAFVSARGRAGQDDRILAFGSFLTVAAIMRTIGAAD